MSNENQDTGKPREWIAMFLKKPPGNHAIMAKNKADARSYDDTGIGDIVRVREVTQQDEGLRAELAKAREWNKQGMDANLELAKSRAGLVRENDTLRAQLADALADKERLVIQLQLIVNLSSCHNIVSAKHIAINAIDAARQKEGK
jgi:hypothetical protein